MAEALLMRALKDVVVTSAGTDALIGQPADPIAQDLMAARGISIEAHRARQINSLMCAQADLVLVMDVPLRRRVEAFFPSATGKVFRLGEFAKHEIPDPYRQSREAFGYSLSLIEECIDSWAERIRRI